MGVEVPSGYGMVSIRFQCTGITDPMITTFGFRNDTAGGTFDTNEVADDIAAVMTPTGKWLAANGINAAYTLTSVDVTMGSASGPQQGSKVLNQIGTLAGAPAPPNVAFLVQKRTSRGGRKGRGRMFIPPWCYPETQIDPAGNIEAAVMNGFQTRLNTLLTDLVGIQYPMVLLHSDPNDVPDLVTSLTPLYKIATQRRRLR